MDRTALTKLKRHDLQQIARREGLKANGKNSDIIELLIAKYSGGIARRRTRYPRKGKPQCERFSRIKPEPEDFEPVVNVSQQLRQQKTGADLSGHFSRLPGTPPGTPPRPERLAVDWVESVAIAITQPAPAESTAGQELSLPPPPGYKDVRFVRRELVDLVNSAVTIRAEVAEAEAMLKHAVSIYNDAALDFREMSCIRRTMERSFVAVMKKDRTIWDGMFMMENDEDKDAWAESKSRLGQGMFKTSILIPALLTLGPGVRHRARWSEVVVVENENDLLMQQKGVNSNAAIELSHCLTPHPPRGFEEAKIRHWQDEAH